MKLYKIILVDKREEFIEADSYTEVDDKFVFFRSGTPVPDVFFRSELVAGISVASDDSERDSGGREGISLD